jgi:hypothetical protein
MKFEIYNFGEVSDIVKVVLELVPKFSKSEIFGQF